MESQGNSGCLGPGEFSMVMSPCSQQGQQGESDDGAQDFTSWGVELPRPQLHCVLLGERLLLPSSLSLLCFTCAAASLRPTTHHCEEPGCISSVPSSSASDADGCLQSHCSSQMNGPGPAASPHRVRDPVSRSP